MLPGSSESTTAAPPSESSSSGAGSDGSSSSGDVDASTSTSSTTETGSESSTGGEPVEPLVIDFDCCEPGCTATLEQGHPDVADVEISGDRLLTHDVWTKTVLWDRTTRRSIHVERGAVWAGLAGDLFWTADLDTLRWRDANDGSLLGETSSGARRGAARDGAYLWVGTATGLTLFEPDGTELWFEPGDYTSAHVFGVADTVHVHAPQALPGTMRVIDLGTGEIDDLDFDGAFGGWFETSPRWFAYEGLTYRVYDETGEELAFGLGGAMGGFEDYVLIDDGVRRIDAPNDVLVALPPQTRLSRGAILSAHEQPQLVELFPDGIVQTPFVPPSQSPLWTFAYEDGEWIAAGNYGLLVDGEGDHWAGGRIDHLAGATSGRLVASSQLGTAYAWDLGDACDAIQVAQLEREARTMALADSGAVLAETRFDGNAVGTRLLSLPDLGDLAFLPGGTYESSLRVSDDGNVVARYGPGAVVQTTNDVWFEVADGLPIYVAPNGVHAVAAEHDGTWMGPERTYVIDESGVVDVLDGLSFGFLDDDTMLVGRYASQICEGNFPCEVFLGADIVALDGTIVQATSVPEVPRFERVTSTEILVLEPPRIFDAYTGELLWMSEVDGLAAAVGADHVVVTDGGDLVLHRWR